ncbi:hypothetical protein FISHEDRAFT_56231 [Fistulina hepatica ATCC 64428]|uniref:SH3 domain-containing protein n=1 Tax=Fistulina hepatica ATCC 64428 TaxID=1128425 RepID=A0A0D7AMI3_9AGAR|nr:hypothetical protein FISHEDRAFT_56231 [Fistulina hepatica ATCC 64428]
MVSAPTELPVNNYNARTWCDEGTISPAVDGKTRPQRFGGGTRFFSANSADGVTAGISRDGNHKQEIISIFASCVVVYLILPRLMLFALFFLLIVICWFSVPQRNQSVLSSVLVEVPSSKHTPNALTYASGEVLEIIDRRGDQWWLARKSDGSRGSWDLVPYILSRVGTRGTPNCCIGSRLLSSLLVFVRANRERQ